MPNHGNTGGGADTRPASAAASVAASTVVEDFTTALLGAVAKVAVGHPLETIKTRLQAAHAPNDARSVSSLLLSMARSPVGLTRSLYSGIAPVVPGLLIYSSTLFAVYGATERALRASSSDTRLRNDASVDTPLPLVAASGAVAGAVVAPFTTAMDLIRLRQQADPLHSASTINVVRRALRSGGGGGRGLLRGLAVTAVRETPANAIYFATYAGVLRAFAARGYEPSAGVLYAAGGLAGSACWLAVYPIDTVKCRVQVVDVAGAREADMPRFRSSWQCARELYAAEGARGFFRGLAPCLARGFVANGANFLVIDLARRVLFPESLVVPSSSSGKR